MLQIDIVGSNSTTGELILEVGGRPNKGNSAANKKEKVHWKVKPHSGVDYLNAITMKNIPGSSNVFSADPPAPQGNKKNWKGTVNSNAPDFSVYVYKIEWVPEGSSTPKIFDPIITIKPTDYATDILPVAAAAVALASLSLLLSIKFKKNKKCYDSSVNADTI